MRHLLLAFLAAGPAHGYELKRRHDALFGAVGNPVNIGQIYVTLGRLERDGLVEHVDVAQETGPDRKDFSLTDLGEKELRSWLEEPAELPATKSDLLLKLAAASITGASTAGVLAEHRHRCLQAIRDLDAAAATAATVGDDRLADLLVQGAALHLQAELRWLDHCDTVLRRDR